MAAELAGLYAQYATNLSTIPTDAQLASSTFYREASNPARATVTFTDPAQPGQQTCFLRTGTGVRATHIMDGIANKADAYRRARLPRHAAPQPHPLQMQFLQAAQQAPAAAATANVQANLVFNNNVPEVVRLAASYVAQALGNIFPPGHNRIEIAFGPLDDPAEYADSYMVPERSAVRTKLNSAPDVQRERGLAYYLVTLTHEFFLHGANDLAYLAGVGPFKDQEEEHAVICTPAGPGNRYLQAIRQVLAVLPDDPQLKGRFLNEYWRDVYLYAQDDEGNIGDALQAWLDTLEDAVLNPQDALWRTQPAVPAH